MEGTMTKQRTRVLRGLTAVLLGITSLSLAAAPAGATSDVAVPDEGRFLLSTTCCGTYGGAVNAVQATSQGTIVYLSVGALGESPSKTLLGFGVPTADDAAVIDASLRLVRVIDTVGSKVYRPLQTQASPVCICTPIKDDELPEWDPAAQMLTLAVVLPPLPESVSTVDVDVTGRGQTVTGVKVTRGEPLTPTTGDGKAVVTGTGWPQVDLAQAASVTDPAPFITDLIANTEDLDLTQRVQKSPRRTDISVSADVLFAVDKADLTSKANSQLARVATQLKAAQGQVTITGYTDSDGSDSYNLALSKRRADSVLAALKKLSPGTSFSAVGKGEADPVASNSDAEGKKLNRRVTISFATAGGK